MYVLSPPNIYFQNKSFCNTPSVTDFSACTAFSCQREKKKHHIRTGGTQPDTGLQKAATRSLSSGQVQPDPKRRKTLQHQPSSVETRLYTPWRRAASLTLRPTSFFSPRWTAQPHLHVEGVILSSGPSRLLPTEKCLNKSS